MLKSYQYNYANCSQDIADLLNELFADEPVTFSVTNNSLYFTGKLWDSSEVTTAKQVYHGASNMQVWVDMEKHFLCFSTLQSKSGKVINNATSNIIGYFYAETEDGDGVGKFYGADLKDTRLAPFYTYGQVLNFENISNYCTKSTAINDLDLGNEFTLEPLKIGGIKLKKLYICEDNICFLGRKVSDGSRTFLCIGTGIFYDITE